MSEIQFFGEIDIHPTKKIIHSEYPAWYFDRPFEQLGEEVGRMERLLERGGVPPDKMADFREQFTKKKDQLQRIQESIPKLSGEDKTRLAKARKDMAAEIRAGYYTRTQMVKGLVDIHKEAERMVKPMVEVKPEFVEILKGCNIKVENGKVSRDNLVKAWKIAGKLLNRHGESEETNAETLRRD
jgi:hypothetical protein